MGVNPASLAIATSSSSNPPSGPIRTATDCPGLIFSNIFLVDSTNYYVYLYSLSCSHCAELINPIIEYALSGVPTIYFVQESSSVVIDEKKAMNINVTNIDDLGIRGFPTLLVIENKTLINQYAGVTQIRNALHI